MHPPEHQSADVTRRDFLKGGSFATLMAMMGGVELVAEPAPEAEGPKKLVLPKVKVAVIGLGPWGREILDQLGRLEQADVVAICDNYPAMLKRSATKAPGAALVEDYQTILANPQVQAVIVATATHQHKEIAVAALQAGRHVYCEAPLANSITDAQAIARAAKGALGCVFQAGLQFRSSPQRHFLLPFIRSGALGKTVMARAQWHKKTSWRQPSPNPEREQAINWRLQQATSSGLVGEIGIHALDQAAWMLNLQPVAVTGFQSTQLWKDDGRDVADTVDVTLEFAGGARLSFNASLATSYESEYELLHGSDGTILLRDGKAWMFKEVDSPLLGWEIYARKETFHNETGIVLAAGSSKQVVNTEKAAEDTTNVMPPLYSALEAFLGNCAEISAAVEDFRGTFGAGADRKALAENLAGIELRKGASWKDGYSATVLALKANEAVTGGQRIELKPEAFEPA